MKKREPEDEQLCIAVHTIKCSIITPRHIKINRLDHTGLHNSRTSTISAEECQLALTEEDFLAIQKKMDKIDQRLDDLYKNWHAEYRDAATLDECDKIKKFYKPYLEKYESKYRILYHSLQQPSVLSTQEMTSGITPSLAALDVVPSLK